MPCNIFTQDKFFMPLYCGYGVHAIGFVHATLLDRHACVDRHPPQSGLHQCAGRLARPHHLTTPRTTRPSALATGSCVRASLQRGGQLARPHRFTTPRPVHPSARMADSSMIDVSFTVVIINSAVDIFWLTYQVKSIHYIFILYIAFL